VSILLSREVANPTTAGERAGLEARRALGLNESQPLDDILRSLERTSPLQVFVRPLGDGIAGGFCLVQDTPFVIVNADHPVERQRFTLAHEFGHFRMEHGNRVDETVGWGDRDPLEVEANAFAAAFLMPPAAVADALARLGQPDIDFDVLVTLAAIFGVSAKAMRVRLETLGEIGRKKIDGFDRLIEERAHYGRAAKLGIPPVSDTLALARRDGGRMPPLMEQKVLRGIEHELIPERAGEQILRTHAEGLASMRERSTVASE
jgi:Zn-dependent peptidase ImmA (M78 family)